MLPAATYQSVLPPTLSQRGPSAVDSPSTRLGRQDGTPASPPSGRTQPPTVRPQTLSGVRIAGTAPSLSAQMIGVFGALPGAPQSNASTGSSTSGSRPIDPLTGEIAEIDPFTGRPRFIDPLSLSREQARAEGTGTAAEENKEARGEARGETRGETRGVDGLTEAERAEVRRLQAIDRQVRQHEAAHKAAGAGVTGPATFTYVTGPDGKQYAVAGEVSITVSGGGSDPEQVIRDMEQVQRAALAPADPSPQDRAVAAAAQAAIAQAEAAQRDQDRQAAEDERAERRRAEYAASDQTDAAVTRMAPRPAGAFASAAQAYGAAGALASDGLHGAFGTPGPDRMGTDTRAPGLMASGANDPQTPRTWLDMVA